MFIAKTDTYKYLGYKDGYHQFCNQKYPSTLTFAKEAKFIDKENDIVFFLKDDGAVEPSYSAVKNKDKDVLEASNKALFGSLSDADLYSITKSTD